MGAINHTHAAFAELPQDAVVCERLADHWGLLAIVGRGGPQVNAAARPLGARNRRPVVALAQRLAAPAQLRAIANIIERLLSRIAS